MNLSQRLDQARTKRDEGVATETGPTPFDLRMSRDAPVYDGRHLRTGEEMTSERWTELESQPDEGGLPTWKPERANDLVTIDLRVDIYSPTDGVVLDLTERRAETEPSTDDVFEMPAWARGTEIFRSESE